MLLFYDIHHKSGTLPQKVVDTLL